MGQTQTRITISARDHASLVFRRIALESTGLKSKLMSVSDAVFSIKSALVGLGAGLVAHKFLSVASTFESLSVSLETAMGSSEKAAAAFDWIKTFAATTPYELEEVTQSFIKLQNYGLDPIQLLKPAGDTASAFSKSLDDAVEAIADASTGEFERLKEFGIRASQEKDKVTLAWSQGGKQMEETIDKTSSSIITKLLDIFQKFDGGMEKQSKTWKGLWSNMLDTVNSWVDTVMNLGPFQVLKTSLGEFLAYLETSKGKMDLEKWALNTGRAILQAFQVGINGASSFVQALSSVAGALDVVIQKLQNMGPQEYALLGAAAGFFTGGVKGAVVGAAAGFGAYGVVNAKDNLRDYMINKGMPVPADGKTYELGAVGTGMGNLQRVIGEQQTKLEEQQKNFEAKFRAKENRSTFDLLKGNTSPLENTSGGGAGSPSGSPKTPKHGRTLDIEAEAKRATQALKDLQFELKELQLNRLGDTHGVELLRIDHDASREIDRIEEQLDKVGAGPVADILAKQKDVVLALREQKMEMAEQERYLDRIRDTSSHLQAMASSTGKGQWNAQRYDAWAKMEEVATKYQGDPEKVAQAVEEYEAAILDINRQQAQYLVERVRDMATLSGSVKAVYDAELRLLDLEKERAATPLDEKLIEKKQSHLTARRDLDVGSLIGYGANQAVLSTHEELADYYENILPDAIDITSSSVRELFSDIVAGGDQAANALASFGERMAQSFADLIMQIGLAILKMEILNALGYGSGATGGGDMGATGGGGEETASMGWDDYSKYISMGASLVSSIASAMSSSAATGYATGGSVPGVGDRDTVPAMLMPGEFVLRKSAVKRMGVDYLNAINEGRVDHFAAGGLAGYGGQVSSGPAAQPLPFAVFVANPSNSRLGANAAASPSSGSSGQSRAVHTSVPVTVVNVDSPERILETLGSQYGQNVILNTLAKNKGKVSRLLRSR
ncbi:tape measure protein [Desulfovibrio inopinatus]|uniref:tape measure protein n=1 Tax=Desulfovibrio inopinatus TaxID=102109 RepID=UPI0003FE29EE|nr:tape measure protein [Desulfovibrio inopinatus]